MESIQQDWIDENLGIYAQLGKEMTDLEMKGVQAQSSWWMIKIKKLLSQREQQIKEQMLKEVESKAGNYMAQGRTGAFDAIMNVHDVLKLL